MRKSASISAALLLWPGFATAQLPSSSPSALEGLSARDVATDRHPSLRARALEFAGAMANEGFNVRDGFWSATPTSAHSRLLAVNLFAGNRYWFCVATAPGSGIPKLAVYDPQGNPLELISRGAQGLAAAGATAGVTGQYFVEVTSSGGPLGEFCLVYLFQ